MTFEQFMQQVDRCLLAMCGLSSDDIDDYRYRDCFDSRYSPERTARMAFGYAKRSTDME